MQALILAAGCGSRLGGAGRGLPKALVEVGGRPILDRQLQILEEHGIGRVCLVTGYAFDQLERRYGDRVEYRFNPFHRESNNLVSFLFARDWIDEDLIVLYADLLYESEVLGAAVRSRADVGLVVDRRAVEPGHALVAIEAERILAIDPRLDAARAHARFVGIGRFSRRGVTDLLPELKAAAEAGLVDQQYYHGVRPLIARGYPVEPIDVSGRRWMEVDYPEDLARARREWR